MKKITNILILGLFCLMVCTMSSCGKIKNELIIDYPSLENEEVVIKNISVADVKSKIENKDTFVLMMGFPACPWCQAVISTYNLVSKNLHVDNTFYVNIKDARDNEESIDHSTYLFLKEYCKVALDAEKDRINAPTIIVVKNGKLVAYHVNTVASHIKNDAGILPPMTDEQIRELEIELTTKISLIK